MNPSQAPSGGRDNQPASRDPEDRSGRTPNSDMQAEDAGSEASGAEGDDSATAATRAMKQTSKTAAESDNRR